MPNEQDRETILARAKQAEVDFSTIAADAWLATWNQRPVDRSRTDESYLAWDRSIYKAAEGDYWPEFARGIEQRDRDAIYAASAVMSAALVETYRRDHAFGGSQHINSPEEEISVWIRSLTARCWHAPEQEVIALFLHPGEHLIAEGISFEGITTERGRVLLRADLPALTGKRVEDFTSEDVIEEARMSEARDAEAARHQPWESNYYTSRSGRRLHLADVEGREKE